MLKDYIALWAQDLIGQSSLSLNATIRVTGERDQPVGPRREIARVTLTAQPAPTFEVVDMVPESSDLRQCGYPECVVFGLLDVLMVAHSSPLCNVKVILEIADFHPIHSSAKAFRHAGRDAGRQIFAASKKPSQLQCE
jgi:hypothetical protein